MKNLNIILSNNFIRQSININHEPNKHAQKKIIRKNIFGLIKTNRTHNV